MINKIDLLKKEEIINLKKKKGDFLLLSAEKDLGTMNLISKINLLLKKYHTTENNFLARKRHLTSLKKSLNHVKKSYNLIYMEEKFEILANEIYLAQLSLEEISGEFTSDDLLGKIFNEFCIGK